MESEADLLEIVDALGAPGRLSGRLYSGHDQPHENADDGDDDQQLDEGKRASWRVHSPTHWFLPRIDEKVDRIDKTDNVIGSAAF